MISKIIGIIIMFFLFIGYVYYTLWVFVKVRKLTYFNFSYSKPFLTEEDFLDKFFLDKYWAIAIPNYMAVLLYTMITIFIGLTLILSYKKVEIKEDTPSKKQKIK